MNTKIFIIGLSTALVCAGAVEAKTHHASAASAYAAPSQPVPYAALGSYIKASPQQRATRDWSMASASPAAGAAVNTSATQPLANSPPDNTAPGASSVNPPTGAAPMAPSAPQTAPSTMTSPAPTTPNTTAPDSSAPMPNPSTPAAPAAPGAPVNPAQ